MFHPGKPISAAALVDTIERAVAEGVLRTDERLPPVRALAAATGLAPNTGGSRLPHPQPTRPGRWKGSGRYLHRRSSQRHRP